MTSRRKTKKYNAKIVVRLWKDHTPRDVKHYSRGIRRWRKWLRQNPRYYWKLEADRIGARMLRMPSFRLCGINEEEIEQWKHEVLDEIGRELDIPELRFSRDKIINGDGYV